MLWIVHALWLIKKLQHFHLRWACHQQLARPSTCERELVWTSLEHIKNELPSILVYLGGKQHFLFFFLIFFFKCKHFKGLSKSLNSLHGYQITLKDWCFDDFSVNESKTYGFYFRPNTQGCKNQGQSSSKRGTRSFDFKCLKAVQDVQWNRPADRTHRSDYILLQDKDGFYRQDGILEILTCRDEIR